jgi:hypothetical protein
VPVARVSARNHGQHRLRLAHAAAGLESTIIRPGMFASNVLFWWAAAIRAGGVVRWPYGAAETAPVDDRDVAAVAARTLYQDGHAGGDYVLTGPESLSQAERVSIIGDVLGRRIKFEELSPDEFRSETEGSWPRPVVGMLLAAWGATIGRSAFITSTVSGILGSVPRSFRQWVADHATAFMEAPPHRADLRHGQGPDQGHQGARLQGRRDRDGIQADRGRRGTLARRRRTPPRLARPRWACFECGKLAERDPVLEATPSRR